MRKSFDHLKRISLLLTAIYVALVLCPVTARAGSGFFGAEPNRTTVLVYIDKTNQQMTVSLDGAERYRWPVSTGRPGYSTPSGTFTATSMNEVWYSKEFDNAPMPHSIFFMKDGHAIHGSYEVKILANPYRMAACVSRRKMPRYFMSWCGRMAWRTQRWCLPALVRARSLGVGQAGAWIFWATIRRPLSQ